MLRFIDLDPRHRMAAGWLASRGLCVRVWLLLFALLMPTVCVALPVDQYLQLRRQLGFDHRLTAMDAEANPGQHAGRVVELVGTVNGVSRYGTDVSFMLTQAGGRLLFLRSRNPDAALALDASVERLRILARVRRPTTDNADVFEPVAMALDAEVSARERQAAARMQAAAEAQARAASMVAAQRGRQPSRGLTTRPIAGAPVEVSPLARRYLTPAAQAVYGDYARFIAGWNRRLTATEVDQITVSILYFAGRHRVDPRLVVALIIAESNFNPRATSRAGAMGLGQLMPVNVRANRLTNPYDPVQNVRTSVNLLTQKLQRFRTPGTPEGMLSWRQIELALASYNAGGGAVRRFGGVPPFRETQNYIRRVKSLYRQLIAG